MGEVTQGDLFPSFPVVDALKRETHAEEVRFDGKTYSPKHDQERLAGQTLRVFNAMRNGEWFTLDELHNATDDPHASISARLRDLRKIRFGGHQVERRPRGERSRGLFEYRLVVRK